MERSKLVHVAARRLKSGAYGKSPSRAERAQRQSMMLGARVDRYLKRLGAAGMAPTPEDTSSMDILGWTPRHVERELLRGRAMFILGHAV